jgi:type II secretory pathway component PulM
MKLKLTVKNERLKVWLSVVRTKSQPLADYWNNLTTREQQFLYAAGGFIGLLLIALLVSFILSISNSLVENVIRIEQYRQDAAVMAKEYRDLSQTSGNQFSSVSVDKIKGDATEVLNAKSPNIVLQDNVLQISVDSAKFEAVTAFLDQLRKSYGLFPSKLTITRLSQSGYVALNATFMVEQQ